MSVTQTAAQRTTRREGPRVHPTAVVHPGAQLADGVEIGPYCVIGDDVSIGEGTVLHSHVSVQGPTSIGRDNVVHPFAVLGSDPQDLKFRGERTTLEIGDRNVFREHVTLHRGTQLGGGRTVIGSDCLLMVGAHVAHDCLLEDRVILANAVMLGGHCLIETGATVAGGAGIHHFTTVGQLSFVGGLARITKDVPPFLVVEGSPAEPRKVNTTALLRKGWDPADVERVRAAFKALYRANGSPMNLTIERLRSDNATEAVTRLCDFLERMQMGIHGRWRESLRDEAAPRYGRR